MRRAPEVRWPNQPVQPLELRAPFRQVTSSVSRMWRASRRFCTTARLPEAVATSPREVDVSSLAQQSLGPDASPSTTACVRFGERHLLHRKPCAPVIGCGLDNPAGAAGLLDPAALTLAVCRSGASADDRWTWIASTSANPSTAAVTSTLPAARQPARVLIHSSEKKHEAALRRVGEPYSEFGERR